MFGSALTSIPDVSSWSGEAVPVGYYFSRPLDLLVRKIMMRHLLALCCVVALSLTLVGCKPAAESGSSSKSSGSSEGKAPTVPAKSSKTTNP